MRFITFLKQLPKQEDTELQAFINWAHKQKQFPLSSEPVVLVLFLYNKLNPEQTMGLKKALMIYSAEPKNMLPLNLRNKTELLKAINLIDAWQHTIKKHSD